MYASQKNVQILIALLKSHNVRHIVISPGSRNMAIVRSVETDPFFTCYSVVDERSAAYFAIGISLANNAPVALSSTSAQATRNYIPGMTEAYYRGTPLVVITSDYKPSAISQGTMQAIQQMSIPADTAKVSVQLPIVNDDDDFWFCGRLVNEALLGLTHNGTGPVHINIPVEEHWEGGVESLPDVKKIDRYKTTSEDLPAIDAQRILVVVGEHPPFTPVEEAALGKFVEAYGAVVYTNHLSNYHGPGVTNGSLVISGMDRRTKEPYKPDLLITIGQQPGDYGLDAFLKWAQPQHWRVHEDGKVVDTYKGLTAVFQFPESTFFEIYAQKPSKAADLSYQALWRKANASRVIPDEIPLSHAFIAGVLAPRIPESSVVHFAILSAFRNWSFFDLDASVEGYSNVAAFGIDGCLSAFIGHSVGVDKLSLLIIGDLSFFYDMNAIGIRHIRNNARVVLVNNSGGGEFRAYSHAADQFFGNDADAHIAAAGHWGSARGWAESLGWNYIEVRSKQDVLDSTDRFLGDSDAPILMEVFTSMKDDSEGVRLIREANTHQSLERRLGKLLSPEMKRAVKKALGR